MNSKRTTPTELVHLTDVKTRLEAVRYVDRQNRMRLKKAWRIGSLTGKQKAASLRAIERIVRKDKKYNRERTQLSKKDLIMLLRGIRSSTVLDYVYPRRSAPGRWIKFEDRKPSASNRPIEIDLERFSFIDNPEATLDGFLQIAKNEATAQSVRLNFKDNYCLDVVPYMLLTEFWTEMLPVFRGGEMQPPMQKVLAAIGIEEDLKVGFPDIVDFADVWAFPLTRRRRTGDSRSRSIYFDVPTRDHAADRFCDALEDWLARPEIKLMLSQSGRGKIKVLLNELLENAERHSDGTRRDGAWTVAGFMAKRDIGGSPKFIAHIGIVSIGDTFAESMQRASTVQKDKIEGYVTATKKLGAPQSRETLVTLAALQDGVTCVPETDNALRGGTGLMEMVELTNLLGFSEQEEARPEITIVSGNSCVQLKNPYFNCVSMSGEDGERVQWCNSGNSAKMTPEETHVFDLKRGLPGTAISIRFILDPQYLQDAVGKKTND